MFMLIILVNGCSFTPAKNYTIMNKVNGRYYAMNYWTCAYGKIRDNNSIYCYDREKTYTGYIFAMSNQEVDTRRISEARYKQKQKEGLDKINSSLRGLTNTLNNSANQNNRLSQQIKQQNQQNHTSKPKSITLIYSQEDCIGSVVNGKCYGTLRASAKPQKCYGTVVLGKCIGTILVD